MQHIYIVNSGLHCGSGTLAANVAQQCMGQGFGVNIHEQDAQQGLSDWWLARDTGRLPPQCVLLQEVSSLDLLGYEPGQLVPQSRLLVPLRASNEDARASVHWLIALGRSGVLQGVQGVAFIGEGLTAQAALCQTMQQWLQQARLGVAQLPNVYFFDWPSRQPSGHKASWLPLLEWLELHFRHALIA